MENKLYSTIIKLIAIMVSVLAGTILATVWIVSLPLLLVYELVVFLTEYLTGERTSHNYAANNFIKYYKAVKHIYVNMLDESNFSILTEC